MDAVDLEILHQLDSPQNEIDEEELYSQNVAATMRNMTTSMAKIKI